MKIWLTIALAALVALLALPGCDKGGARDDDDSSSDGDSDGDGDGDSDSDSDADECEDITWGSGLTLGQVVANWAQSGYIDADDDGVVEQEEVDFTLEDVNCTAMQSMILIIGDTS